VGNDRSFERALRWLCEATARRCRGPTAVLGGVAQLAEAIRSRGLDAVEVDPASESAAGDRAHPSGSFGTAVLCGVLEHASEKDAGRVLARAWDLVRPGGRLIVTVPNKDWPAAADAEDDTPAREWNRRRLRRLLKRLGKPRLATDQPFRWLTMYVDKPRPHERRFHRTRHLRYRVTARLCRGKVIELGCGEGELSAMVCKRGHEVCGVDLSAEKIRRAREQHPEIPFIASDIRSLSLPDSSFDTAVLAEVLEHVDDAAGAEILAKAWALLKPRGRLIVSVPNEDCIPHPHHVRTFDRRGLKRLLAPLGRPRLVGDQPFKWLLMYVDKRPS
jgi:2-polyprenyl-3-methyl-5-hydroxy-6-metoxy-1,4-benzoquinol methylase